MGICKFAIFIKKFADHQQLAERLECFARFHTVDSGLLFLRNRIEKRKARKTWVSATVRGERVFELQTKIVQIYDVCATGTCDKHGLKKEKERVDLK